MFRELAYVRRIHFTLTLFAAITITVTALGRGTETQVYLELQDFQAFASEDIRERLFRRIFSDRIRTYRPSGIPDRPEWFLNRIASQLIRLDSSSFTIPSDATVADVRRAWEETGVRVAVISTVKLERDAVGRFYEWRQNAMDKGYELGDFRATVHWPTDNSPGRIDYFAEAGIRPRIPAHVGGELRPRGLLGYREPYYYGPLLVETTFLTSAFFETQAQVWRLPKDWFERAFPYLAEDWDRYSTLPLKEALADAKTRLVSRFFEVMYPRPRRGLENP